MRTGHEINEDWVVVGTGGGDGMFFLLVHDVVGVGRWLSIVEGVEEVLWCNGW